MRLSRSLGTAENREFAENWCGNKIGIPPFVPGHSGPIFREVRDPAFIGGGNLRQESRGSHHTKNSLKAIDLEDVRSQTDVHGLGILDHLL